MEMNKKRAVQMAAGILGICLIGLAGGRMGREREENSVEKDGPAENTVEHSANKPQPDLSGEEQESLDLLFAALEEGNLENGAEILIHREELFAKLFYETLEGEKWLYDGSRFSQEIQGDGMVLTSSAAVFKGSFQNGYPQGNGLALQAFHMEKPRYDYTVGFWEQGKMNGTGETGYCYYKGAPEGETTEVARRGNFKEDRMDGMVRYTTFSRQEGKTSWDIQIQDGKILLDQRWSYDGAAGDYHLSSSQEDGKVYAVKPEEIEEALWVNLLVWGDGEA